MSWKPNYIANQNGKVYSIKKLSLKQTNSYIGTAHQRMKVAKKHLDLLYERRAILMEEPVEKGKSIRKIKENLGGFESKEPVDDSRATAIILLALKYLEQGADVSLVADILRQARDDE